MFDSSFERALSFAIWVFAGAIWLFGIIVGMALGWFIWGR